MNALDSIDESLVSKLHSVRCQDVPIPCSVSCGCASTTQAPCSLLVTFLFLHQSSDPGLEPSAHCTSSLCPLASSQALGSLESPPHVLWGTANTAAKALSLPLSVQNFCPIPVFLYLPGFDSSSWNLSSQPSHWTAFSLLSMDACVLVSWNTEQGVSLPLQPVKPTSNSYRRAFGKQTSLFSQFPNLCGLCCNYHPVLGLKELIV